MIPGILVLVAIQVALVAIPSDEQSTGQSSPVVIALTMLSLIPVLWLVAAQVRALRRADEFQRTVQLESLAVGFAGFVVIALAASSANSVGIGEPAQLLQITTMAAFSSG